MSISRRAEGLGLSEERLRAVVYAYELAEKILQIPNGDTAANDAPALAILEIAKSGEVVPERIAHLAIQIIAANIEAGQSTPRQ